MLARKLFHTNTSGSQDSGVGVDAVILWLSVVFNLTAALEIFKFLHKWSTIWLYIYNIYMIFFLWYSVLLLGYKFTNWPEVALKYISNQYFLQEMANFNPNSIWNNILVQNETVEKYSNVHRLVKPIEYIFAKTKVLSPCHMMHPILD